MDEVNIQDEEDEDIEESQSSEESDDGKGERKRLGDKLFADDETNEETVNLI